MHEAVLFLADGFEEIEAIATLDILRRGGVNTVGVSLTGKRDVMGVNGITILADLIFDDLEDVSGSMLILPGGRPGTAALRNHELLLELLRLHNADGGKIAAICAAPTILGALGILADKTAVCYPTREAELNAAKMGDTSTVTDGNITTSRGPGTTIDFALELVRILKGDTKAAKVAEGMLLV